MTGVMRETSIQLAWILGIRKPESRDGENRQMLKKALLSRWVNA